MTERFAALVLGWLQTEWVDNAATAVESITVEEPSGYDDPCAGYVITYTRQGGGPAGSFFTNPDELPSLLTYLMTHT